MKARTRIAETGRSKAESVAANSKKLAAIDRLLEAHYGPREPRNGGKPLDILIRTILSQNTNDRNSRRAYDALRAAFPTWEAVLGAPRARLERVLKPGGLARIKSARIQRILRSIAARGKLTLDSLNGLSTEDAERRLLEFGGVGYKTARCVLLFAMGRDVFPIDTHIFRVLSRLGVISDHTTPDKAHRDVSRFVPSGRSYALHLNLIALGRDLCRPRNPDCARCPVKRRCLYFASRGGSAAAPQCSQ